MINYLEIAKISDHMKDFLKARIYSNFTYDDDKGFESQVLKLLKDSEDELSRLLQEANNAKDKKRICSKCKKITRRYQARLAWLGSKYAFGK